MTAVRAMQKARAADTFLNFAISKAIMRPANRRPCRLLLPQPLGFVRDGPSRRARPLSTWFAYQRIIAQHHGAMTETLNFHII